MLFLNLVKRGDVVLLNFVPFTCHAFCSFTFSLDMRTGRVTGLNMAVCLNAVVSSPFSII